MMSKMHYYDVMNGLEAEGWEWEEADDRRTIYGGAVAKRFTANDGNDEASFVIECEDEEHAYFEFDDEAHPAIADIIKRFEISEFERFVTDRKGVLISASELYAVLVPADMPPADRSAYLEKLTWKDFETV